jgi:hypothetical protein
MGSSQCQVTDCVSYLGKYKANCGVTAGENCPNSSSRGRASGNDCAYLEASGWFPTRNRKGGPPTPCFAMNRFNLNGSHKTCRSHVNNCTSITLTTIVSTTTATAFLTSNSTCPIFAMTNHIGVAEFGDHIYIVSNSTQCYTKLSAYNYGSH